MKLNIKKTALALGAVLTLALVPVSTSAIYNAGMEEGTYNPLSRIGGDDGYEAVMATNETIIPISDEVDMIPISGDYLDLDAIMDELANMEAISGELGATEEDSTNTIAIRIMLAGGITAMAVVVGLVVMAHKKSA
ncbi:hypothetical protein FWC63_01170 [Candidatus Saccharibacteria bacterium]|nr:hypothetical protein [Candidatus Saccharibacteria bacterium]